MESYNWKSQTSKKKGEGIYLKTVHSGRMTVAHWSFDADTDLPEHSHPHEQIALLQEGRFALMVQGEERELEPGEVVVIPPDVPHSGRAITASRVIDIFSPVREDMRD